jgi:hypothetical protein
MDEELIRQVLEKYFSDFKEYHLLILVGFTVIVALILIIQSIWVSRKIERFKSVLKKSEIKYSAYNQLQIESLSKIYQLLSDFSEQTFIVGQEIDSVSPERIIKTTKKWLILYKNVYITFSREKYILPKDIKEKYASIFSQLENMKGYVKNEKDMSAMFYTWETGEVEFMGDDMDRITLFDKLKEYKKDGIINQTIDNTTELRKKIEQYFENIE